VLVAVAMVAFVILLIRRRKIGNAIAAAIIFGFCGLLTFAPWLVRTWAWAGNPVFPELPQLGHGYFSQVQVARWQHAHVARPDQRSVQARLKAGWDEVLTEWQFGFLLIPLALGAIIWFYRSPEVWFLGAMLFLLAVFWLGFTHLQARFFALSILVCYPARFLLMAQLFVGFVLLNRHFFLPDRSYVMYHGALGNEDLSWLTPPALNSLPSGAPLVLVGDAKAFLYQVPMSRLNYRTIFGADTTDGDVIKAWAGPALAGNHQWLLIDPIELERFQRTYQPFPPLPADITAHDSPYVIRR
jgi:hypothetical protein